VKRAVRTGYRELSQVIGIGTAFSPLSRLQLGELRFQRSRVNVTRRDNEHARACIQRTLGNTLFPPAFHIASPFIMQRDAEIPTTVNERFRDENEIQNS
jgi:hypothetical protein